MKVNTNALDALDRFLFPVVEAEFSSLYFLSETINRLRAASYQKGLFSQVLGGEFREDSVTLYRDILFLGSPCAPVFTGSFRRDGDRVVLRGRFRMRRGAVVYQYCMLAFVVIMGVFSLPTVIMHSGTAWTTPLFLLGFIILIVGQSRLSQWSRCEDTMWISRAIIQAINVPAGQPSTSST